MPSDKRALVRLKFSDSMGDGSISLKKGEVTKTCVCASRVYGASCVASLSALW